MTNTRVMLCLSAGISIAGIAPDAHSAGVYDCLIEATYKVELRSPVVGRLSKVYVQRGDTVEKGQVIATLESSVERASAELAHFKSAMIGPTLTAENKLEFSKRKFARHQDMYQENFMSAQERDDAEAELRLAEAELQLAKENKQLAMIEWQQQNSLLNLRTIRSPISGVVVDQNLYPGEIVEPGNQKEPIVRLAQLDPLRVHVVLPFATFGQVKRGMTAVVIPELPVSGRYKGEVKNVDRLVDAASGTYVVLVELDNPKLEIPAGIKCVAEFAFNSGSIGTQTK